MSPLNITQPLGIWSINVYNGYYKVMSNIPKSWDIYQPLIDLGQKMTQNSSSPLFESLKSVIHGGFHEKSMGFTGKFHGDFTH